MQHEQKINELKSTFRYVQNTREEIKSLFFFIIFVRTTRRNLIAIIIIMQTHAETYVFSRITFVFIYMINDNNTQLILMQTL